MVDWRRTRTDFVMFFDFEIEKFMRGMAGAKGTVVRFTGTATPVNSGGMVSYCSNITARFVGLGSPLVLTPYGLYRRLLKAGGEVVFSWRDESEKQQTQAD